MTWTLHQGDCLEILPTLGDASVDAVVTDPPYPEIDRDYGRWTEAEWWELMMGVCREVRRVLKPAGSAVFVLQPNSERLGRMRPWLFRFQAWACEEWNMVQDAWWWNVAAVPTSHVKRDVGLMRPSVKAMVWCGPPECYRDQSAVLWGESEANAAVRAAQRARATEPYYTPRGGITNKLRATESSAERGGVTPYNLLPTANTNSTSSAGTNGHSAGTPLALMRWWVRYICPPGGTVLDPFAGSGTLGLACEEEGRDSVMVERHDPYCDTIRRRMREKEDETPLFRG